MLTASAHRSKTPLILMPKAKNDTESCFKHVQRLAFALHRRRRTGSNIELYVWNRVAANVEANADRTSGQDLNATPVVNREFRTDLAEGWSPGIVGAEGEEGAEAGSCI